MNVSKNIIKTIYKPYIITSLNVIIQNPMDENGHWNSWSQEDVDKHLQSVRDYFNIPPKFPESFKPYKKLQERTNYRAPIYNTSSGEAF